MIVLPGEYCMHPRHTPQDHFRTVFLCKYVKHDTVYQSDIVFYLDKVSISDVATVTRPKQLNIVLFCGICFASSLVYFFKRLLLFLSES